MPDDDRDQMDHYSGTIHLTYVASDPREAQRLMATWEAFLATLPNVVTATSTTTARRQIA